MARQPQVVTAVIRPCESPVPKETKKHGLAQHTFRHDKSKGSEPSQKQQNARSHPSSGTSIQGNFAKPTASTLLKSRHTINAASDGKTIKAQKPRVPPGLPKRKEAKTSSSNASAPAAMHANQRKPQLPAAARGGKVTSSGKSQSSRPGTSSTAGSAKQYSSPASSRAGGPKKSTSLSSRAPQTSSGGRQSSRVSAASTRTRYPAMTSATSDSARRRSPSPSAASGRSQSSRSRSPRPERSASHEARLNQIKDRIDHLRRTSPHIVSPEFTSTRTNLAPRSRSPSPTADTSRWQTGNSTALFASPLRRPGARSRSRSRSQSNSRSRSRSRSPGKYVVAAAAASGRRTGTTRWVETRNRAPTVNNGRPAPRGSPPPTWQSKRHLPRVAYPRPGPTSALRARSSSSQTRRLGSSSRERHGSGDERVTLRSRGGRRRSPSPGAARRVTRLSRGAASPRGGRAVASPRSGARTMASPRGGRTPASPRGVAGRTPAGRAVAPSTIDYSPQSRYMTSLLKKGAVRRPAGKTGKENRRPGGSSGSETGHCGQCGSVVSRGGTVKRQAGRRPSQLSQRSALSEPVRSPRKPARSILRSSNSGSNKAASDPISKHGDYDWVSDMLDLSAPVPRSRRDVQSAKRFRDQNWSDTHARTGGGRSTTSGSCSGKERDHKCVHEYYINSRLFPTPLYTDGEGRSQCPVCLAVGQAPAARRSRSRSPGAGRRSRSGSSVSGGGGRRSRPRSRSPVPVRAGVRSRSPTPSRAAPFGTPARRARSRSPAGSRRARSRGGGGASRRRASPARRRSSVSWHDEVALAAAPSRSDHSRTSHTSRTSRGGSVCVTCPNCHHELSLPAAELSDVLSDSLEPPRGRRVKREPAPVPAPSPPPRLEAVSCPGEEDVGNLRPQRRGPSPAPAGSKKRRSPVTLRSRAPESQQPVRAMFTVPTSLFHDAREECGSCVGGDAPDWDPADPADPVGPPSMAGRRPAHPLWPRQLDLSPTAVRPIARGWPRQEAKGNLGKPADPFRRTAMGHLETGKNPAPRRSLRSGGSGGVKNTFSLRRCIGEKI